MFESIDKLLLRFFFGIVIMLVIFLFRYTYSFMYPTTSQKLLGHFYPSKNPPHTIHLFTRIVALAIVFSEFQFNLSNGIWIALLDFFLLSTFVFILFHLSFYILESIVLYNFEFQDEITKKKNYAYAILSAGHAISIGWLLKTILSVSEDSFVLIIFLWLMSMVLVGMATKLMPYVLPQSLNRNLIQKNLAIAFSYSGFIMGTALIITSAFRQRITDIRWYTLEVIIALLLSLILIPFFKWSLVKTYSLANSNDKTEDGNPIYDLGEGIYDGIIFFTACYLSTVVTGRLIFGNFYPIFY